MQEKEPKKTNPLEELKKIGLEKIAEDTHILPSDIEAILKKEFPRLNRTKAFGFIKILEREYKLDLSDWKKEYQEYLNSHKQDQSEIFVTVKEENEEEKENKLFLIIGTIALIIIGYGTYYFFSTVWDSSPTPKQEIKTTEKIESKETQVIAKEEEEQIKTITTTDIEPKTPLLSETNETNLTEKTETNETVSLQNKESNETKEEEQNITKPDNFIIEPRAKVWAGVIFLDDYSKKQFLTDQNISLDSTKDFLIITGHGKIDIYIGEEKKSFDEGRKLYLLYKDGSLEKIDAETFKTINRGKSW